MKKFAALLLSLSLVFTCCAALAETTENTTVYDSATLPLPDGAIMDKTVLGDYLVAAYSKEGLASVTLLVAPSELYTNQSLADLSDEEKQTLTDDLLADLGSPTCEELTTPSGNNYFLVKDNSESPITVIVTLYRGYFIQLNQFHEDSSALTEADEAFLMDIFYGLDLPDAA